MKTSLLRSVALAATLMAVLPAGAQAQDKPSEIVWGDTLPKGLDPHVVYDVPMQFILLNNYDGLFRYVGNPPELQPWLAEGYEVSDDALTWTITLKPDVTFHDGSALTADDVVYSFKRLLEMGQGPSGAFKPVLKPDNVTKVDDLTVQFVLDKPYTPFLAALPLVAIVNEDLVKEHEKDGDWGAEWLASNEAGSGAYSIDPSTYRPQENVDMMRFEDHFYGWDDNANPVDIVRAAPVKETSTRVLALIRGDIDATDSYLPTDQVERVEKADGVHVAQDESMRVMLIRMNNQRPPFDNKNFRKCVSHAFNYDGFISIILKDYAIRNAGPIPNNLWGAPADLEPYSYDIEKAKEFCDAARAEGADLDRPMEIQIQSALDQTTQSAQLLQAGFQELGLTLNLVPSTWAQLTTDAASVETTPDMWVHWVSTYFVDPENWIGQMYDSQFHGTWKASSWYQNDKVDELLREARAETDQSKRATLYEEASRIVVEDAADVWIYNTVQLRGLSDKVQGYKFSPVGSGGDIRWISIED
ncbi:ABC transporter substrate-binding protein [Acuticoccus sediminis]|uniref:ABC transporter substrate-binding protein n=1 Tax=Acuticoccus sediminis TaxID=2184697 RepID=UPI001CFC8080|nr:ABC transporter substrate-binding protein [Acuticoccus sediminis]